MFRNFQDSRNIEEKTWDMSFIVIHECSVVVLLKFLTNRTDVIVNNERKSTAANVKKKVAI